MIKLVYCITRKKGMTIDEFHQYWKNVHGPIGASIPGIRRFVQSHTISVPGDKHLGDFDGMVELWFDSEDALLAASGSPEWQLSSADEDNFIDHSRVAYFVSHEYQIAIPGGEQVTAPDNARDAAAVYYSLLSVRNQEAGIAWARYNIFALLNVGLAAAILTQSASRWMTFAFGLVGLVLATAWLQSTFRGWRYLCGRWEGYIIRFEENLPSGSCIPPMFKEIAIKEGRMKVGGPAPTEDTVSLPFQWSNYRHYVPTVFVLLWAILVVLASVDCLALLRRNGAG